MLRKLPKVHTSILHTQSSNPGASGFRARAPTSRTLAVSLLSHTHEAWGRPTLISSWGPCRLCSDFFQCEVLPDRPTDQLHAQHWAKDRGDMKRKTDPSPWRASHWSNHTPYLSRASLTITHSQQWTSFMTQDSLPHSLSHIHSHSHSHTKPYHVYAVIFS